MTEHQVRYLSAIVAGLFATAFAFVVLPADDRGAAGLVFGAVYFSLMTRLDDD